METKTPSKSTIETGQQKQLGLPGNSGQKVQSTASTSTTINFQALDTKNFKSGALETAAKMNQLLINYGIPVRTKITQLSELYYLKLRLNADWNSLDNLKKIMNDTALADDNFKKYKEAIIKNYDKLEKAHELLNKDNINYTVLKLKSLDDLNVIYDTLIKNRKDIEVELKEQALAKKAEKEEVGKVLIELWTTFVQIPSTSGNIKNIINNITNKDDLDNKNVQNDLDKEINAMNEVFPKTINDVTISEKIKNQQYIKYINILKKLMIDEKKKQFNKFKEIGTKVIELDKTKQQLKELQGMLAKADQDEEKRTIEAKREKNLEEVETLEPDQKAKALKAKTKKRDDEQKGEPSKKKLTPEERERLMKEQMVERRKTQVGRVDKVTKKRKEDIKKEGNETKAAITNLENVLPSVDIIPEQLRPDEKIVIGDMEDQAFNTFLNGIKDDKLLKDQVTGNKKLFSDVLKQKGAEIRLLQGKPTGKGEENAKETIVLTTTPMSNKFSIDKILVVDSNNKVKWLDINDSTHFYDKIEEEQDTFKIVEDNIAKKIEKSDKIFYANYGKFTAKDEYIKLLVDIDYKKYNNPKKGGGKRKSKSRKSKKRRKGRKNKTKKRSKSKK